MEGRVKERPKLASMQKDAYSVRDKHEIEFPSTIKWASDHAGPGTLARFVPDFSFFFL